MVEFELLQSRKRAVPRLHKLEPSTFDCAWFVEDVARRFRLSEERPCDEDHSEQRKGGTEGERKRHAGAVA